MPHRTVRPALVGRGGIGLLCAALLASCAGQPTPTPADGSGTPAPQPTRLDPTFDLEAHRGGAGLKSENSLTAFGNAMALGVSTLELDVQVTKDDKVVVTHDQIISPKKCQDGPVPVPEDPAYPYVSRKVKDLTLKQLQTLRCGDAGETIPELSAVFALVRNKNANDLRFNIEIKTDPTEPDLTAPKEQYIASVWREIDAAGLGERVSIQSFDWSVLRAMPAVAPKVRLVALTSPERAEAGLPGASPWMDGADIDAMNGDIVKAAQSIPHLWALSPRHDFPVDAAMVERAHSAGLRVIPWTVNDANRMGELIDLGVDGIITDHPDALRDELTQRKFPVPAPAT